VSSHIVVVVRPAPTGGSMLHISTHISPPCADRWAPQHTALTPLRRRKISPVDLVDQGGMWMATACNGIASRPAALASPAFGATPAIFSKLWHTTQIAHHPSRATLAQGCRTTAASDSRSAFDSTSTSGDVWRPYLPACVNAFPPMHDLV
jgi:hypothetical protein